MRVFAFVGLLMLLSSVTSPAYRDNLDYSSKLPETPVALKPLRSNKDKASNAAKRCFKFVQHTSAFGQTSKLRILPFTICVLHPKCFCRYGSVAMFRKQSKLVSFSSGTQHLCARALSTRSFKALEKRSQSTCMWCADRDRATFDIRNVPFQ
jgi:hypothetical protein